MTEKFVIQANNSKADEGAGKVMGYAILLVAGLGVLSYVYQTVVGWYEATAIWFADMGQYLSGFWPF